jgi:hypothetical protein
VLNADEASTDSKVRVFISWSDGNVAWDTVGVHENIIEASWQALVDSFEYYALQHATSGGILEESGRTAHHGSH